MCCAGSLPWVAVAKRDLAHGCQFSGLRPAMHVSPLATRARSEDALRGVLTRLACGDATPRARARGSLQNIEVAQGGDFDGMGERVAFGDASIIFRRRDLLS